MSTPAKTGSLFSINFKRLQQYNFSFFSLDEIVLFEYLMLLSQQFGYKPFYHSTNSIIKETGLKRSRIENILKKFENKDILTIEVKGYPKIKFFTILIPEILNKLSDLYQFAENNKLYAEISKLYVEINTQYAENNLQEKPNKRNTIKGTKKETKEKKGMEYAQFSEKDAIDLITVLENSYNDRRHKKDKKYVKATFGFKNKTTFARVVEALNSIEQQAILNAWLVFTDQIINGEINPQKLLPYFFSKHSGEFNVIDSLVDIHNTDYVLTSK